MSDLLEPLEKWVMKQSKAAFPGKGKYNYRARLESAKNVLATEVHAHVEKGALLHDGLYLTDHGPDHVRTVIRRAGDLIGEPSGRLTPYEGYLLIMAAHAHDAGLMLGRESHEKKSAKVLESLSAVLAGDSVEMRAFLRIAQAHGGKVAGNKDTISTLPAKDHVLGEPVRLQYLAAILRFADELADDRERADRIALRLGTVPPENQIYHQYADRLHTVAVDHPSRTITLNFTLTKEVAVRWFLKDGREVLLLDEIYERTLKMHRERMYCMRFMDGNIRLDTIVVDIEVFLDQHHVAPLHKIVYRLEERGYPELVYRAIGEFCPDLKWTGESLRAELLRHEDANND